MQKKQIIISNYDDLKNPYYGGGGAYAIHETAKRLSKFYKVKVLTGKYPSSKNQTIDGVIYKRIGIYIGGPKIGQLVFQLVLPFYVINQKFDIWLESFTPPFSTGLLQLFTKKRVVGLVHMLSGKDMKRKYYLPFDFFESLGLKTYSEFIVTGESVKNQIAKANKKATISVIPNGVSIKKLKNIKKKKQILFLGRIEINQKGIDLLVKSFKKTLRKANLKLVIAGSGEKKQIEILKKLISEENLEKNVILKGRVYEKEKNILFQESLCLVVPSRFETFSITALEGLAHGIPVVTFNIEGLSWIPKNSRFIAKSFSIKSLSECILRAIDKKEVEEKLKNSELISKKYSWQKSINLYLKYLQGI